MNFSWKVLEGSLLLKSNSNSGFENDALFARLADATVKTFEGMRLLAN